MRGVKMKQLICPYCTNNVHEDDSGCCGESSAHFQTVDICPTCEDVIYEDMQSNGELCRYCAIIAENEHVQKLNEGYRI